MEILLFFESIRSSGLNTLFLGITYLGQQELMIGLFCVLFWLVDKQLAYRIGASAFAGIGLNQLLKNVFAVPRPFVRWPQVNPVYEALPAATGYSFPSGHTANAVAVYGMAGTRTHGWLRTILWSLPFLVALSRMYLGVHTLADVGVSLLIGFPLVAMIHGMVDAFEADRINALTLMGAGLAGAFLLVLAGFAAPGSLEPEQALDCFKAAGGIAGFAVGFYVEYRWIRFSPKGKAGYQVQKMILGLGVTVLLLFAAKSPLNGLFGETVGSMMRYGLVSIWIVAGLPAIAEWMRPRRVC